eukprot:COSAG02_NODE_52_length_44175_cov_97.989654_17_plen_88_part_00
MAQAPNKRPRLDGGEAEDPPLAFFALGEQGEDDTLSEEEDEVEDVVDVGDAAAQTVAKWIFPSRAIDFLRRTGRWTGQSTVCVQYTV